MSMTFEIMFAIALSFMLITRFTDKHAMRADFGAVAKFLAFMAMVTCIRIAGYDFMMRTGTPLPGVPPELSAIGLWRLILVFWEDAFYVLPIYWMSKYEKDKKFKLLTWSWALGLSLNFALGHAYQGLGGVAMTFFYPFFISFRYGKKNGFGTIMMCHILYDFITVMTIKLMPYFLGF